MSDETLLSVSSEEITTKEIRSMFYAMTAKQDCTTRVFKKDSTIELRDIYELNERVTEKLRMYHEAGFVVTANVKFLNGKHKSFSGWKAFQEHQWYESEAINNITITWEFNAILPQFSIPQKHTLTVKMTNSMRPEEMINIIFTGNLQTMEEFDANFFPIVARVDFIDRVLGDELLNIVSAWVEGLSESAIKKSKLITNLKRHKGKLASILNIITNLVVMISSVVLLNNYIKSLEITTVGGIIDTQLRNIVSAVFICAGAWILSRRLISKLSNKVFELLREYGDTWMFKITKGDENHITRMNKQEQMNKVGILFNILGTIVLNIVCGIIAEKLF